MRLIIRMDDVGRNTACNEAAWKTIEYGITTAVHVPLDAPETALALQRLREFPWISVGWQSDFLGKPVRPREKVATLINEDGYFRSDLTTAEDVSRVEALLELRTELFRCTELLGYTPTYRNRSYAKTSPLGRAIGEIDQEFGIITQFVREPDAENTLDLDEQWETRNIVRISLPEASSDPVEDFLRQGDTLLSGDNNTWISQWSPKDADALCDKRISNWIVENGVELVNYHDALFGTREYQNHLRSIGSELSVL